MRTLYETKFGIFDHLTDYNSRPLASVAMFDSENLNENHPLLDHATMFLERNIGSSYNMTFLEFLALPSSTKLLLIKALGEYSEKKGKALDQLDIEKELSGN